jgi:hypothetical protein
MTVSNHAKYFFSLFLITTFLFSHSIAQNTPDSVQAAPVFQTQDEGFKAKYVFLSLLIPGGGEWFLNHRTSAKILLGTEVALWTGYFGTRSYVNILQQDFEAYAAVHARVNTANKDDQYWIDVGNSGNIYDFNEQKRVERDLEATYPENDENYWQWDSQENRYKYNDMRFKRHDWKRRLNFVVGGLILNRLVSAIDVIRILRRGKKEGSQHSYLYFDYQDTHLHGEVYRLNMNIHW